MIAKLEKPEAVDNLEGDRAGLRRGRTWGDSGATAVHGEDVTRRHSNPALPPERAHPFVAHELTSGTG